MMRTVLACCLAGALLSAPAAPAVRTVAFLPANRAADGRILPLAADEPGFLYAPLVPSARRAWTDEAGWSAFTARLAALGRTAREEGLAGLVVDFEDRDGVGQFAHRAEDPAFDVTLDLVRRRAREAFNAYFAAHPGGTLVALQLFAADPGAAARRDPLARAHEERDLFPAFANGMLEVLPSGARLVDGGLPASTSLRAADNGFYTSVRDRTVGVLRRVDPELRTKYRTVLETSFVLEAARFASEPSVFEDGLRQAAECAERHLFLTGGRPADVETSALGLLLRGVADPVGTVRAVRAERRAAGTYETIPLSYTFNEKGGTSFRIPRLEEDGWYGFVARGRGKGINAYAYFQYNGSWRYELGNFRMSFGPPDADGWREGTMLVRIPRGANNVFAVFGATEAFADFPVAFADLEFFRIR